MVPEYSHSDTPDFWVILIPTKHNDHNTDRGQWRPTQNRLQHTQIRSKAESFPSFTGWMLLTGFGSEYVSRCTSVYTTWPLNTCLHSANPCPAFLVVVTYARLVVANWTFPVSIWLRTQDGRLPMPVPHLGTLYLTVYFADLQTPSQDLSIFHILAHWARLRFLTKTALCKSTIIIIIIIIIKSDPI